MNKNLHDIDDLFRSALDGYKETPSDEVKKDLRRHLIKKALQCTKESLVDGKE